MINIYTDGAARGNPGPGGWGALLRSGSHSKELSGGFLCTTNNRMELYAVIVALEAIKKKNAEVTVYSDSSYVCDAVNKSWLFGWEKKGFAKKKNPDLWIRFLEVYRRHNVKLVWIKGHNGHLENERCDRLAVNASMADNLPEDIGYLKQCVERSPDSSATAGTLPL
ncbi:MAG: ribonuclease HI [Bacteroidetes bacterium HGW-Bacteroidetes-8]|jgi:ribonuclease HI|nr:MAG: ribonuclease HI [Bacteroidetes bacterium HGW-Bacteroidetes-8]